MISYFLLVLAISFLITFFTVPHAIKKLNSSGKTVKDIYKVENLFIPTHGALVVFFTVIITCSSWLLVSRIINITLNDSNVIYLDTLDITILLVTSFFAIFGIIDDILDLSWNTKIFIPPLFCFPLFVVYNPEFIHIPFLGIYNLQTDIIRGIDYSDALKIAIIPIYIMVVPNLINMHSGFNGLQTGLSSILLSTVIFKCIIENNSENLLIPCSFLGSILAFWYYNKYPSTIIEGNIGSLIMGSIIGILIVIKGLFFFGIFILIPHIIDFLMLVYLNVKGWPFVKYGTTDSKGTVIAPNPIKMKFLLPYYFEMTEPQIVNSLHLLTGFFCVTGIIIF